MAIHFNESTREFHLSGKDFSYLFCVLKNNQLGHLYYGKKIRHRPSFAHFNQIAARETQSCVYEGDRAFSLGNVKQEYPSYGTTDYRHPAHQFLQDNGSRITQFEYQSHVILPGKPTLDGLPATYVEDEREADTLIVTLADELIQAELRLIYTVYRDTNAIVRSVQAVNRGQAPLNLTRLMSACIDFPDSDFQLVQLSGAWSRERHVIARNLERGIQAIDSTRGTSSSQQNPFLALKRPDATEHAGEVFGFSLVYSGNFLAQAEVDEYEICRVLIGINPFDFNWLLEGGESFQAPEVVMVYSDEGLNGMSQTYHRLYRARLARGAWRDRERPVLINSWEAAYFDFDEPKLLRIASEAKELGVELFVLDDGWFGRRDDDTTSLGDWTADPRKLPNGIAGLAEKITAMGLAFGLWFEPEMVNKRSELYERHPDWIIHVPGRNASHGRNQYVLDYARPEVVDYVFEMMADIFRKAPVSYVKWDMNRYMTEIGSPALPAGRQREVPHRYMLGVYSLYERLTSEFPHILFESCASGGARFDPGMLSFAPQAWTSDDTDAVERWKIQYGTSFVYPLSAMGAHVSAVPNHQVGRITGLDTRGNTAFFGVFGYELDFGSLSPEDKDRIREQIRFYKEHRAMIQTGTFYRLISPFDKDGNTTAWMVVAEDRRSALVGYFQTLSRPNPGFARLPLKGLLDDTEYEVSGFHGTYFGDELMHAGLLLDNWRPAVHPSARGDFYSNVYFVRAR